MSPTGDDTESLTTRQSDDSEGRPVDVSAIDLQALAEEVCALLRRKLVQERERRGWRRIW